MMKKILYFFAAFLVSISLVALLSIGGVFLYSRKNINFDADELLFESARSHNSTVLYYDSTPDSDSYTPQEAEIYGSFKKVYYSSEELGTLIKEGFVAVEDRDFYTHKGINVKRTLYAALNYITRKNKIFGASTITQQVIKNISGDSEVKISRKLSEIIRALNIEQSYSKEEIMELYLNIIPMSENMYGVGIAAKTYFGKNPAELSVAECATLIGITNAPSAYNPHNHPKECKKKRDSVLSVMLAEGVINSEEYNEAIVSPLGVIPRDESEERFNSWFAETVVSDIIRDLSKKYNMSEGSARLLLLEGGFSVYTTMDAEAQELLEGYFSDYDNFPSEIKDGLNYSMTIVDTKSGNLVATVGRVGRKSGNRLLNHAEIPHVPGSVLKPLGLYAPLIDEGVINYATVFDDVPCEFISGDGGFRAYPKNSPNIYSGLITVKDAISQSKNTVAVSLCKMRTPSRVFETLKKQFGLSTLVREGKNSRGEYVTDIAISPMALGQLTSGATLRELTGAFSVFANDGVKKNTRSYLYVKDKNGNTVLNNESEEERIFKESTARIMNRLLKSVVDEGTAKGIKLSETVETAGKTGTSGDNLDKMFVGYTPYYSAGIWCGYEKRDGTVANLAPTHLNIWDEIMTELHRIKILGEPETFSTEGLLYLPYCKDSGKLYTDTCVYDARGDRLAYGYFTPENQPEGLCDRHILCYYDSVGKGIACSNCPRENLVKVALLDIQNRSFPMEIYITDAEFVYRDIEKTDAPMPKEEYPYYYYALLDGEYSGISNRKKQFNSACPHHR